MVVSINSMKVCIGSLLFVRLRVPQGLLFTCKTIVDELSPSVLKTLQQSVDPRCGL